MNNLFLRLLGLHNVQEASIKMASDLLESGITEVKVTDRGAVSISTQELLDSDKYKHASAQAHKFITPEPNK